MADRYVESNEIHIVQCTLYVASSVRQKCISVVVLTVVAGGGRGGELGLGGGDLKNSQL